MTPPQMMPVKSSNLQAIGYDKSGLHVQFKDNPFFYLYTDVPHSVFQAFLNHNGSKGQFHDREIKKKGFKFTKYRPTPPPL